MRFYPKVDIDSFFEISPGWSLSCRNPQKSWHRPPLQRKHPIAHYRDIDGAKLESIQDKDLYFKDWPTTRIRDEACLPWYYCVGNRFIRLERAFPHGFKCAPVPMNLKEIRELNEYQKQLAKEKRARAKEEKEQQEAESGKKKK